MRREPDPLFTVFTPTYNRADTLGRVYASLKGQTLTAFEWLIIDDGSTDHTIEVVKRWQADAALHIRLFHQENRGKHYAFNRAVREAAGSLFLNLDSDDECLPVALERLAQHWNAIDPDIRHLYVGVSCLCMNVHGAIIGNRFPMDPFDATAIELRNLGLKGEKWGFQRVEILRRFPFPEFEGESFIPESIVWNRIAERFLTRYTNEPLRIYHESDDGLSAKLWEKKVRSANGTLMYYKEAVNCRTSSYRIRALSMINFLRFTLLCRRRLKLEEFSLPIRLGFLLFIWPALVLSAIDSVRHRRAHF